MDFGSMIIAIPVVAIIGGITAGILKTRGQQRIIELAQRERIAAIEKGIDPSKLPPLPAVGDDMADLLLKDFVAQFRPTQRQAALRQAQGLAIGGLIALSIGIGLAVMLLFLPDHDANRAWPAGIMPFFIGLALLISSRIVYKGAPAEPADVRPPTAKTR